ncbi:MAG: hypothetical protein GTN73_09600 [Candidatus Aminicenantes bacterium]|nr:hypothetical protein [Candidatus Aminicenantes bacterium]
MYKAGIKILEAKIGIESNREELLFHFPLQTEVMSLLTDFKDVESIPYSADLDGYISVEESMEEPSFEFSRGKARFKGPFLKLTREASDLRFSLWGNQGFLYRYALYLLERKHGIYNFHACALYQEKKDQMFVVIGGAGSGKTVYLLSGLAKGLKLFSTETLHFRIENDLVSWFMGSLVDNVRLGTLMHDFPQFLPKIETQEAGEEWQKKIALDLSPYKTDLEELKTPKSVVILFPRIEEGRKGFLLNLIDDTRKAAKALFDNISQKIAENVILYDKIPVLGFDKKEMALARLKYVSQLIHHKTITKIASVLSNPNDCWGDLLK